MPPKAALAVFLLQFHSEYAILIPELSFAGVCCVTGKIRILEGSVENEKSEMGHFAGRRHFVVRMFGIQCGQSFCF